MLNLELKKVLNELQMPGFFFFFNRISKRLHLTNAPLSNQVRKYINTFL